MRFAAVVLILCASALAGAQQYQIPTDNELRSAYCLSVVKGQMAFTQSTVLENESTAKDSSDPEMQRLATTVIAEGHKSIAELQTLRSRFTLYLAPRLSTLDPMSIAGAMKRGEADWAAVGTGNSCTNSKCTVTGQSVNQLQACLASCLAPGLVERVKACANPTWLPF